MRGHGRLRTRAVVTIVLTFILAAPAGALAALSPPATPGLSESPAVLTKEAAEAVLRAPGTSPAALVAAAAALMGEPALRVPAVPVPDAREPLAFALFALYDASDVALSESEALELRGLAAQVDLRVQLPIARLLLAQAEATRLAREATGTLTLDDQRALVASTDARPLPPEALAAAGKVRLDLMAAGAVVLLSTIEAAIPDLEAARAAGAWPEGGFADPAGLIQLGTEGADRFETRRWLVVDPAGDDVYTNGTNMGGVDPQGDVLLRGWVPIFVAAVVDFGGNDHYLRNIHKLGPWPQVMQGAAGGGVGILWDTVGDDEYLGGGNDMASAGTGVGVLVDEAGNDNRTTTGGFTMGYGSRGIGLLLDKVGDDEIKLGAIGLGSGDTHGVGIYKDEAGLEEYAIGSTGAFGFSFSFGSNPRGIARFYDLGGREDTYPTWSPLILARNNHQWTDGRGGSGEDA